MRLPTLLLPLLQLCLLSVYGGATKDLYAVLSVPRSASDAAIRKAFKALSRKYHPDKTRAAEDAVIYADAKAAYEVLVDPTTRAIYDAHGHQGLSFFLSFFTSSLPPLLLPSTIMPSDDDHHTKPLKGWNGTRSRNRPPRIRSTHSIRGSRTSRVPKPSVPRSKSPSQTSTTARPSMSLFTFTSLWHTTEDQ